MTTHGTYADGRSYPLAPGWTPTPIATLEQTAASALNALDAQAVDRVRRYYDPASNYAGDLLTADDSPGSYDPDQIDPSDLFAVSTLSIDVDPFVARQLLRPGHLRETVVRTLMRVPGTVPISSLDSEPNDDGLLLEQLRAAYDAFRTARGPRSNQWVFAAKLLARKRPYLAPVRDNLVCVLLNDGNPLRRPGLGSFNTDLQVFAYLMTHTPVVNALSHIRGQLESENPRVQLEASDLRLLDVALWTSAVGHWNPRQ